MAGTGRTGCFGPFCRRAAGAELIVCCAMVFLVYQACNHHCTYMPEAAIAQQAQAAQKANAGDDCCCNALACTSQPASVRCGTPLQSGTQHLLVWRYKKGLGVCVTMNL